MSRLDGQTVKARHEFFFFFWELEAEATATWLLDHFGFLASWLPSAATECNLCQSLTRN